MNNRLFYCNNISKSFLFQETRVRILDNLDFHLDSNEFVSIIGSSGCGKSTLLELFSGICKPDKGNIYFDGIDITGKTGFLGYMPQNDLLLPWLNSIENALLPVRIKKGDLNSAMSKVLDLLAVFGLDNHTKLYPHQLSGGLKQRLAFLRTYMTGSKILLLDEPFASLDALTRMQMQQWLIGIQKHLSVSIIMVTHDINEAITVSDRIEIMGASNGNFIQSIQIPHDTLDDQQVQKIKKEIIDILHISK